VLNQSAGRICNNLGQILEMLIIGPERGAKLQRQGKKRSILWVSVFHKLKGLFYPGIVHLRWHNVYRSQDELKCVLKTACLKVSGSLRYLYFILAHLRLHAPSRCERLAVPVQNMLDLHRQLSTPDPEEEERTLLARCIEATDRQIDRPVYELYGLTEEGIKICGGGVELEL